MKLVVTHLGFRVRGETRGRRFVATDPKHPTLFLESTSEHINFWTERRLREYYPTDDAWRDAFLALWKPELISREELPKPAFDSTLIY